jgi:methionyl-tRNA formyltransferase
VASFREEPWEPSFVEEIKALAEGAGAKFFLSPHLDDPRLLDFFDQAPVDLMLAVSWRFYVPPRLFTRPRRGSFVFHDALLPAFRGFSPTIWAMIHGQAQTGASLLAMTETIDGGPLVDQTAVEIGPEESIAPVLERVTQAYLTLLESNLEDLLAGTARLRPQDESRATFGCKRLPEDNRIDWTKGSREIFNLVRAVSRPYPGAFTHLAGQKLAVWGARPWPAADRYVGRVPGRVVEVSPGLGSLVLTGDGGLMLTEVQVENDKPRPAEEVLGRLSLTLG